MKPGKAIKLTLLLGSVASTLYHMPQILEMTEQVKAVGTGGGLGGEGNAFDMLSQLQGLGQLTGGGAVAAEPEEPELRVFSPDFDALSAAQQAELYAAAQRMRPRVERDLSGASNSTTRPTTGANGSSESSNHITIGGIDPSILQQLETLGGAEEVLKQLGGAPKK